MSKEKRIAKARPPTKEQIEEQFKQLCQQLGEMESTHQIRKSELLHAIHGLHMTHAEMVKVEEEEKRKSQQQPKNEKAE